MPDNAHTWEDGPNGGRFNWDDLHPKMMAVGDLNEFDFIIQRVRDDEMSFSAEAVESVGRGAMTFLLARANHHWRATGKAARSAKVTIKVELD